MFDFDHGCVLDMPAFADKGLIEDLKTAGDPLGRDLLDRLSKMNLQTLTCLFYHNDLPGMAGCIQPGRYAEIIHTEPLSLDWTSYPTDKVVHIEEQYWDVHWVPEFDVNKFKLMFAGLPLDDYLNRLQNIKKQFPKPEEKHDPIVQKLTQYPSINGWTTFGFDGNQDASFETTPNRVFQVTLKPDEHPEIPILMMKYLNPPWYNMTKGQGFVDYFRFLTRDVVVARGLYGSYSSVDDGFPGNAMAHVFQQFWMDRKRVKKVVDLGKETIFFSIPILRQIWNQSVTPAIQADALDGEWHVDLIMNSVTRRDHGSLLVKGGGGSLKSERHGSAEKEIRTVGLDKDMITTVIETQDNGLLKLRRVSADAAVNVLVGKVCRDACCRKDFESQMAPLLVEKNFMSQYYEPWGSASQEFCCYYLLRKKG